MEKISIKKFVEGYNNRANESLKKQYIKDNLDITPYVPVLRKSVLAESIAKNIVYEHESYITDDGKTKNRPSGNVKVNSFIGYIMFIRTVIQEYTNLEIDKEHFDTDYDALKQSGLLDILIGDPQTAILPMDDISEFKTIIEMKKDDLLATESSMDIFIKRQVDRFKALGEATLTPLMDVIKDKLDSLSEEDMGKILEFAKKGEFKEV